ncbi:suppressor APC domain-containing protein 2 isoform X1 [Notechis scutatus]|uniref:Suppressor APC domain-containing protein 2 isoform X1 n=1 Tax=Notechis scutatus TaxID=8663 RepID=A0A6J1VFJ4_9SAUR|nr:suppressor APC domain-containing protein 2 isoform X1 [Notechis scutatus]
MAPERSASGLPRAFLQSLRPLYDILDERRRGYVHLREIESRWLQPGGETGPLPPGVLEGLRRAAPASGYLTFERFVLGLRLSLLGDERGGDGPAEPAGGNLAGPAPCPAADAAPSPPPPLKRGARPGGTAAPRSLEQSSHGGQAEQQQLPGKRAAGEAGGTRKPKEPLENEGSCKEPRRQLSSRRRHTITHGVDYEMLKQMKELEKEKDFLLQGLELVEEARGWYHQQLHRLQGHQKQLARSKGRQQEEGGRTQLSHLFPQVQELNQCLWQLLSLSAKPGNSSPAASHSPPATLLGPSPPVGPQQIIHMLKEQNKLLTKEVTDKGHRITQLEQEKSALIKQLFGARAESTKDSNQLDSTFI